MSKIKKMLTMGAAMAIAMLAFGASSAFAADQATCAFTGLAGNLTPPIPAAANDPGGPTTIETGTYHFEGSATCVKVDTDIEDPTFSGVYAVTITSDGDYANRVCGTGTAHGRNLSDTVVSSPSPGWEGPVLATYDITFTSGAGAMTVNKVQNSERTSTTPVAGGGFVQIVPADGNCATTNVGAFTVAGAFTAAG